MCRSQRCMLNEAFRARRIHMKSAPPGPIARYGVSETKKRRNVRIAAQDYYGPSLQSTGLTITELTSRASLGLFQISRPEASPFRLPEMGSLA